MTTKQLSMIDYRPQPSPLIGEIKALYERMQDENKANGTRAQIHGPQDAVYLFAPNLLDKDQEELWVMCLDTRNHVLELRQIYRGSLNQSQIRISEVLRPAVVLNAASIIIAHNHPSGDPTPSPDDVTVTRAILEACKLFNIKLLDHVIIGNDGRFTSLKDRNLLD